MRLQTISFPGSASNKSASIKTNLNMLMWRGGGQGCSKTLGKPGTEKQKAATKRKAHPHTHTRTFKYINKLCNRQRAFPPTPNVWGGRYNLHSLLKRGGETQKNLWSFLCTKTENIDYIYISFVLCTRFIGNILRGGEKTNEDLVIKKYVAATRVWVGMGGQETRRMDNSGARAVRQETPRKRTSRHSRKSSWIQYRLYGGRHLPPSRLFLRLKG